MGTRYNTEGYPMELGPVRHEDYAAGIPLLPGNIKPETEYIVRLKDQPFDPESNASDSCELVQDTEYIGQNFWIVKFNLRPSDRSVREISILEQEMDGDGYLIRDGVRVGYMLDLEPNRQPPKLAVVSAPERTATDLDARELLEGLEQPEWDKALSGFKKSHATVIEEAIRLRFNPDTTSLKLATAAIALARTNMNRLFEREFLRREPDLEEDGQPNMVKRVVDAVADGIASLDNEIVKFQPEKLKSKYYSEEDRQELTERIIETADDDVLFKIIGKISSKYSSMLAELEQAIGNHAPVRTIVELEAAADIAKKIDSDQAMARRVFGEVLREALGPILDKQDPSPEQQTS